MTAAIVIPARYASTRYPGKPLAMVRGATGVAKPLIQRSWEAARASGTDARILIATDDDRIASVATGFGAEVVMTPPECANGTERCAAALGALGRDTEIIVNLQGDALLTPAWFLPALVDALHRDADVQVATPAIPAAGTVHRRLVEDQAAGRVGGTTVVRNRRSDAMYFTKSVVPHVPAERVGAADVPIFLHVGVYAYRRSALDLYGGLPESVLERLEGLEQLRFLDAGVPVRVVDVDPRGHDIWELNNPSDMTPIEAALTARGIE